MSLNSQRTNCRPICNYDTVLQVCFLSDQHLLEDAAQLIILHQADLMLQCHSNSKHQTEEHHQR